jgi:biopolymer transport protein ExbB
MDIASPFVDFALLGAEWVLWLCIGLSVLSIGVMIDRALWMRGRDADTYVLTRELRAAWRGGAIDEFVSRHQHSIAIPMRVALAGIAERDRGAEAVAEAMHGERTRWRKQAEQNLIVLGTLGNNVPFVGLFGTVLGIIGALDRLHGDPTLDVTRELSRALVATAIGLLVAIPAVVAYNYFTRRLKVIIGSSDELAHTVLGLVHGDAHAPAREAA